MIDVPSSQDPMPGNHHVDALAAHAAEHATEHLERAQQAVRNRSRERVSPVATGSESPRLSRSG